MQAAYKREWVNCPVCGESDMPSVTTQGGQQKIECTNLCCASNGGTNVSALRAQSPATWVIQSYESGGFFVQGPVYRLLLESTLQKSYAQAPGTRCTVVDVMQEPVSILDGQAWLKEFGSVGVEPMKPATREVLASLNKSDNALRDAVNKSGSPDASATLQAQLLAAQTMLQRSEQQLKEALEREALLKAQVLDNRAVAQAVVEELLDVWDAVPVTMNVVETVERQVKAFESLDVDAIIEKVATHNTKRTHHVKEGTPAWKARAYEACGVFMKDALPPEKGFDFSHVTVAHAFWMTAWEQQEHRLEALTERMTEMATVLKHVYPDYEGYETGRRILRSLRWLDDKEKKNG